MKKLLIVSAVIGLLSAATTQLQAQLVPLSMNFKITVQAQGLLDEPSGSVYKSTIVKIKVTTKDIIGLLGVAYNTTFSNTVSLVVDDNSGDFLLMEGSNLLHNVTADGYLSNFFDTESDWITKGNYNGDTGAASFVDLFTNEIRFRDNPNNNQFTFTGLESWKFHVSSTGNFKDSFALKGQGTGEVETPPGGGSGVSPIIMSGSVSGKASGILGP